MHTVFKPRGLYTSKYGIRLCKDECLNEGSCPTVY